MNLATPCVYRTADIEIAVGHAERQMSWPSSHCELKESICRNCLGDMQ